MFVSSGCCKVAKKHRQHNGFWALEDEDDDDGNDGICTTRETKK